MRGRAPETQRFLGSPDFRFAGQEDEDALVGLGQRPAHGSRRISGDRLALRLVEMARLHGKDPARRIDHWRIAQMGRNPRGIERGRHHQNFQIVAQAPLDVEGERQAQVSIERAFVEFVEDHQPRSGQLWIRLQPPGQYALGDDLDPGSGRDPPFKPYRVADRLPDLLAQRLRHAVRGIARGEPAWLQHDDLAAPEPGRIEKLQGHARRLARTGLGHEQGGGPQGQRLGQLRDDAIDRKIHGRGIAQGFRRRKP